MRRAALPSPGGEEELHRLAARVFAQHLDRAARCGSSCWSRASPAGGFAIIDKTHHTLIDGVSGST